MGIENNKRYLTFTETEELKQFVKNHIQTAGLKIFRKTFKKNGEDVTFLYAICPGLPVNLRNSIPSSEIRLTTKDSKTLIITSTQPNDYGVNFRVCD